MKTSLKLIFAILVLHINPLAAQQKEIKDFSLANAADNRTITLSSYANSKAVVVIFTSNQCPYDKYYIDRIKSLAAACKSKNVPVLLVNSHGGDAESMGNMAKAAKANGFTMPYLADKSFKVVQMFDVKKSPEAFLLQNKGGKFSIAYRGAIDNNPQVANDVKEKYLSVALDAVLAGKAPSKIITRPTGCMIKRF